MIESIELIKQSVAMMIFTPFIAVWIAAVVISIFRLYIAK